LNKNNKYKDQIKYKTLILTHTYYWIDT